MTCRISTLVFLVVLWRTLLPNAIVYARNPAHQTGNPNALDYAAQGEHIRLETEYGPVQVWRPLYYDWRTAGIVVYVHGYFTTLDQTWSEDHLDEQFQASGRNAIFIAPQSPRSNYEEVSWTSLEALLQTVDEQTPFGLPHGPVVVMGHSGAFRTILYWLNDPRVRDVILLDGLYSGQREFSSWMRNSWTGASHRMVLVASITSWQSNRLARHVPGAVRRSNIPEAFSGFTPQQVHARLLSMRSQYEHADIITGGKVIPLVLQLTELPASPRVPGEGLVRESASIGR
jgi:hypothetical protein